MIEELDTAWLIAHGSFNKCELCEEYITDDAQEALIKAQSGYRPAHKACIHQLTLGVWDEQIARVKASIPLDSPYDNAHIADPKVRKALQLNTPRWEQALYAASLLTGGQDETTIEDMTARINSAVNRGSN